MAVSSHQRTRRPAISSEGVKCEQVQNWSAPVYPKSGNEARMIRCVVSSEKYALLFEHLDPIAIETVVLSMFKRSVPAYTNLIKQGDVGDNFYIVEFGHFDIFVERSGLPAAKVSEAEKGDAFGELALLYNAPRAATCVATEPSEVWCLDRQTFRMMLVTNENTKKKRHHDFLENVEIFKALNRHELNQLSDILRTGIFYSGDAVIKQGDMGDRFYLVVKGELVCKIREDGGPELEVMRYNVGGHFGELSLLCCAPRKASVYVFSNSATLLSVDKTTFDRVLGPIMELLKNNATQYVSYKDILQKHIADAN